jgi:hypothetical protein
LIFVSLRHVSFASHPHKTLMKAATITELKREIAGLPVQSVLDICIRMAKYKKENKELLTYLLFDSDDQKAYIKAVKEEMDFEFGEIKKHNIYLAAKSLRKILRTINKYIKFAGNKQTEAEMLIYYCQKMNDSGIRFRKQTQLLNLFERQILKSQKAIATLHEDLQYDYTRQLEDLDS